MSALHVYLGPATPGSAEVHRVREEVLALAAAGRSPTLLAPSGFPAGPAVALAEIAEKGPLGLFAAGTVRRQAVELAKSRTPSCVHAHGWNALRLAHQVAHEIGIPLVCDVADAGPGGRIDKAMLALPDRIVSGAASVARRLAAELRPGRAVHLPISLDPSDLPPAPAVPFRLPPRDLLVVFAPLADGDPESLLAALDAALSAHDTLHLVLLGEPIGAPFMKAVSAHRMVPRVTFGGLPPLPAAARLFAEARAVLVTIPDPGLVEAHVLLALASGAPILSLPSDDARAMFGGAAIEAPAGDAASVASALADALAAGRRPAQLPAPVSRRPALAERLLGLYGDAASAR